MKQRMTFFKLIEGQCHITLPAINLPSLQLYIAIFTSASMHYYILLLSCIDTVMSYHL